MRSFPNTAARFFTVIRDYIKNQEKEDQWAGAVEPLALIRHFVAPTIGGRVSGPIQPLRAALTNKAPGFAGDIYSSSS